MANKPLELIHNLETWQVHCQFCQRRYEHADKKRVIEMVEEHENICVYRLTPIKGKEW